MKTNHAANRFGTGFVLLAEGFLFLSEVPRSCVEYCRGQVELRIFLRFYAGVPVGSIISEKLQVSR